jgi:crossover junction endodeoxyribonuclease RusA
VTLHTGGILLPAYTDGQRPQTFTTTLYFDYPRAPLTANQRYHWRKKAKIVAEVRLATRMLARRLPELGKCRVTLTWVVNTKTRRDADNIVPTLKAMCDGLVDAGVVTDDTPDLMDKLMPVIEYQKGANARMELRIEMVA